MLLCVYLLKNKIKSEYRIDLIFYSQNLFQKNILNAAGWVAIGKTMNTLEEVSKIARTQTFCILCSTITSYWLSLPG